jgi:hypothetical protein
MYLNYHPTNDCPISLDNVLSMIGFANKGNAKKTLENNFTKNEDYKFTIFPRENGDFIIFICAKGKIKLGDSGGEQILFNVDTLKNLYMI